MNSERRERIRSSGACRRRLDELYMPILDRLDNGDFNGEGGSDAYDQARAEFKEAYLATPNLGCMMDEELNIFIRSQAFDGPVEMEDLDEPDEEAAAAPQQGACGSDMGEIRLLSGEIDPEAMRRRMEDAFIQSIVDPNQRLEVAKAIKVDNMDTARNSSSKDCRARLQELFKPIKDGKENGTYKGEEGHTLYQVHLEKFKREYQHTPNLGVMKSNELDAFIDGLSDTSTLIEKKDKKETRKTTAEQEITLGLLLKMARLFQQLFETFKEWAATRSDNINWLYLKAARLGEMQKGTNKCMKDTTLVSISSSLTGTGIVAVSLIVAPVSFGSSLALVGAVSGGIGILSGIDTFGLKRTQRNYDLAATDEAEKRLLKDKEQAEKIKDIITSLESLREEIIQHVQSITARRGLRQPTEGDFGLEVGVLDSMAVSLDLDSEMPVLKTAVTFGSNAANVGKVCVQVADDVADVAKLSGDAVKLLGGVALVMGLVSVAWDAYTLVKTNEDIDNGSKSEVGERFREHAEKLKNHVNNVFEECAKVARFVNEADAALKALMKRYSRTIGNPDMN